MMLALILSLVVTQDVPKPPEVPVRKSAVYDDYAAAYKEALARSRPLLVWVGQKPRVLDGVIGCYQPTFYDYPATCVIVSIPAKGSLWWVSTLNGTPSDSLIHDALHEIPYDVPSNMPNGGKSAGEAASGAAPVSEGGPARVSSAAGSANRAGGSSNHEQPSFSRQDDGVVTVSPLQRNGNVLRQSPSKVLSVAGSSAPVPTPPARVVFRSAAGFTRSC